MNFVSIYVFASCLFVVQGEMGAMLGPGIWSLLSIDKCPEKLKKEVLELDIVKHRLNRTHEAFDGKLKFSATIDDSYGVYIDVCKFVEGGCKQYQVYSEDSIVNLLYKYSTDMVTEALLNAKIDPPEFPVHEGIYELKDFVMDWCTLPRKAPYGKFETLINTLENNDKVACIKLTVEFNKFEDENYCDDE